MIARYFNFLKEDFPLQDAFFYVPLKILFPIINMKPFGEYSFLGTFISCFNGISAFVVGVLFFVTTVQMISVDLVKSLNSFGPAFSMMVSAFKYVYVFRYRKEYAEVVDFGRSLFFVGKCLLIIKKIFL